MVLPLIPLAFAVLAADFVVATPPDAPHGVASEPTSQSAQRMAEKMGELRALFEKLECEQLIVLAPAVEDHRLATKEQRHEAMFRRGYCLVVIGNTGEADALFRDIMREDADAQPSFPIEQRVLALVESARTEIVKERERARVAARQKLVERIAFELSGTPNVKGGNRVFFDVRLTDPDDVVKSMRVDFRRKGEREYYALPVTKKDDGWWRGEVPGTYTRSSQGMTLEWFLTLSDDNGEALRTSGTREAPHTLEVLPGSAIAEDLEAKERVPQPTRFVAGIAITPFFTIVGVAAGVFLSVGVAGGLGFIDDGLANVVGGLAMLSMPIGLGSGMVFLNASTILDAPDSWLATGVVAGALFLGEVCLLADWVIHKRSAAFALGRDFSAVSRRTGPPIDPEDMGLLVAGAGLVAVGAFAGAVTTPILVGLDAPTE